MQESAVRCNFVLQIKKLTTMSKITTFSGQPQYLQILNLANRSKIQEISKRNGYDRYVKKLDGYTHFVAMLFAVLMRYDSLREIIIGLMAEASKLQHLGVNYLVRRSTLSEANNRRSSAFFGEIYQSLFKRYKDVLADSRNEEWLKHLYILDSTTITLFSDILKGAGRNPKTGKKKGGIKAHTVIKADENMPCLVRFTSAATHDQVMLKYLTLPEGSILAIDRAYIDYAVFQSFTERGITYVTKMKKNLTYEVLSSVSMKTEDGIECQVSKVQFKKGDITHEARIIEYCKPGKTESVRLLTNDLEAKPEWVISIYDHRWQIETLFKQLKQNFPLKYFYGDSVNAIESQIWVTMIANLLLSVIHKRVKHKWAFSNMVTMIRQMLMYYIDLYAFLEDPEGQWLKDIEERKSKPPKDPQLRLFD